MSYHFLQKEKPEQDTVDHYRLIDYAVFDKFRTKIAFIGIQQIKSSRFVYNTNLHVYSVIS